MCPVNAGAGLTNNQQPNVFFFPKLPILGMIVLRGPFDPNPSERETSLFDGYASQTTPKGYKMQLRNCCKTFLPRREQLKSIHLPERIFLICRSWTEFTE
jgi:hypothetical protein